MKAVDPECSDRFYRATRKLCTWCMENDVSVEDLKRFRVLPSFPKLEGSLDERIKALRLLLKLRIVFAANGEETVNAEIHGTARRGYEYALRKVDEALQVDHEPSRRAHEATLRRQNALANEIKRARSGGL